MREVSGMTLLRGIMAAAFLVTLLSASAQSSSVILNYTEKGELLFHLNASLTGCYASLGAFPHWCLGNISKCAATGITISFWFKPHPDAMTSSEITLLTTGGTTPFSDGLYVTRRFGDQFEVGVAQGEQLWKTVLRLQTNYSWTHIAFSWTQAIGLKVWLDGLQWTEVTVPEIRSYITTTDAREVEIGIDRYGASVTSSCSFELNDVEIIGSLISVNDIIGLYPGYDVNLLKGCLSSLIIPPENTTEVALSPTPSFACRQHCYTDGSTLAFLRNTTCSCRKDMPTGFTLSASCSLGSWQVFWVHHGTTESQLTLRGWSEVITGHTYTKPKEDIRLNAAFVPDDPKVPVTFSFEDGTSLVTSSPPLYRSFDSAGSQKVMVTAVVGSIKLSSTISVTIEDVDEGTAPKLVLVTSWHEPSPRTATHSVSVFDDDVTNCTFRYGDGTKQLLTPLLPYGSATQTNFTYEFCGRYNVVADCNNTYGSTSGNYMFLSRALSSSSLLPFFIQTGMNYTIDVAGSVTFLKELTVAVNGTLVQFDTGRNSVVIPYRALNSAMDNLVEVKSAGVLVTRHLLRVERRISKPLIETNVWAEAWSLTANITVTIQPCDFGTLQLDFGIGNQTVILYIQKSTEPIVFWRVVTFPHLGAFLVNATICSDLLVATDVKWMSVEVPITSLDATTRNVESLTEPILLTLNVNAGSTGPDRVNFLVDYGDGTKPVQKYHLNNAAIFQPVTFNYTYKDWGTYTITVIAGNNITNVSRSLDVQVGEAITFIDLTTSMERVSLSDNVTFSVNCPNGSDVTYTLNFGDGTTLSVEETSEMTSVSHSVAQVTSLSSVIVTHHYMTTGYYNVSVTATNTFNSLSTSLCPTVVVDNSGVTSATCTPPIVTLVPPHDGSSLKAPVFQRRSLEGRVQVQASVRCPQNVSTVNYSWKAAQITVKPDGKISETTVYDVCRFQDTQSTLVLPPRTLTYGLYRLTVTVAPTGYDLVSTTKDLYLQVTKSSRQLFLFLTNETTTCTQWNKLRTRRAWITQSEPVSIIDGGRVQAIMVYGTAILDISGSYDPDLDTDVRQGLTFHLFCMPESAMVRALNNNFQTLLSLSTILGNKTTFRMTSMNDVWFYEYQPCFKDAVSFMIDVTVYNGKIRFPAEHFLSSYFSFAMLLWTERAGLTNMTSQIIEVHKTNTSMDDLGSLLDLALNADPDTAIRLIGGAADAILSADSSSAEEQEKLAKSAEAVVNTLGSVAKRVDNANQATKCAGTIKTMTSNKDLVTQGSRASAADAFLNLANSTQGMEDATVEDASLFAGEALGGLGNIFPAAPTEVQPTSHIYNSATSDTVASTTIAEILSARNISLYTTTPFSTAKSTTTPMTPKTTTSTIILTTQSTTTIAMTIPPRSSTGSFTFNGSNYTISGVTISSLAITANSATTTMAATTTTSLPSEITDQPISDWMLIPETDPRMPVEVSMEELKSLPPNPTYRELFSYIFNDCLLFRKVMKSDAVQTNCPVMTSSDVNLMKCDGDNSLQDRVFSMIIYLEHPDDIYEVYIKPLNTERKLLEQLRRLTDAKVTGAGVAALGTVADTVNDKAGDDDTTQRAFNTQRFGMKLQKVKTPDNSTDGGLQTMTTSVGSFSMPTSLLAGVSDCPNINSMFLGDSDNPYTFSEEQSSVGKGVVSLGYSCSGQKLAIQDTSQPIELWIERDATQYRPGLFVLLTDVSNTNAQFNYHPVNLTEKNSSLQVVIRPGEITEAFEVYIKYGERPNITHNDFMDSVPKADLSHLKQESSLDTLGPEIQEEFLYTVSVPRYLTTENGTYWVGIKLKKGTVSMDNNLSNATYTLVNLVSGCRFWDETNNTWSSAGCQVGQLTSRWKVQCMCTHLTSFGSDAVVPPNTIDFSNVWAKFNRLNENAAVFATVISLIGIYGIMIIWARYMDKKDLIKWGAMPLEDNLPTDNYHYQLTVYTGVRTNAGTDSHVRFIMSGDEGDTGVRRLYDGKRKHLGRGTIFNYILSVEGALGGLTFMRIWHDNSGKGKNKSWYLDQIQVTDLQTGEKWYFLCDRWLAVEEDDGMVDRILPVAGINDLIAFKHLFSASARKKLANDHLWFSVFSRPTRSNFTRVQRISCCMSLLFLTMITNAMWFKTENSQEKTTGITLGPFQFTLGQVFISFASTLIVFPVNFLLVLLFRRCRPKKNTVMQTNQAVPKSNQKYRWKNISNSSAVWGPRTKKSRLQKLKDTITDILDFHQQNKYDEPEELVLNEQRQSGTEGIGGNKKKKPWSLPHWCIFVAWALCFLSITASGFFTILYSMEWGTDKANQWLTTFLLSFFQSVIVVQPVKVLLMVALIACILKKPDLDEEDLNEDLQKVLSPNALFSIKDPVSLSHVQLERQRADNEYAPPDPEVLKESRELRLKEIKMEAVLKEIIIYFFFVIVIFFISYQQRDPVSYNFGVNIRNIFIGDFESIKTIPDYWTWLEGTFLPAFFATSYANGTDIKYWRDKACIADLESRRLGVGRIRQMRIKEDTCTIQKEMEHVINHCRDEYSWTDDDASDYNPGWEVPSDEERELLKDAETPWVYQNSVKLKNAPYVGTLATYKGGGYVILTKREVQRTEKILREAKEKNWLDLRTRAVFVEFTVYNPNVNLFASVILLTEFINTGGASPMIEVKIFRLLSYIGGWGLVVLLFEVTYAVFTLYFFYRCICLVKKERLQYFVSFWNLLEFVLLCFAVACIVLYSFKHILTEVAMSALKNRESDGFVNFQSIALYDETYGYVMSAVVFMATVQFLKLLKFNQKMGMLGDTIKLAAKDLKVFSISFLLYFSAFVITAYLLFGQTMTNYNNIINAAESMFAFALGAFDFQAMSAAQPFLGPLFFFSYIMVVYIGLMSIFLTIIGDSFTRVKENVALRSNEYEMVEFMWKRFKDLLGFK